MNTLLTTSINWSALKDSVMAFFNHFSVLYGIEILLLFTMIFFVSKVLRENEATKLMVLYWFMLVVGGAMRIFDEQLMTSSFYFIYVIVVSSMMLILFSAEVKKYFWDVHTNKMPQADPGPRFHTAKEKSSSIPRSRLPRFLWAIS